MAKRAFICVLASVLHGTAAIENEPEASCAAGSSDGCEADSSGLLQVRSLNAGCPSKDCSTTCVGKDIRVVTDMGFDDWGAFSILHAAGCTPTRALATKGMMLPSFAGDFSELLQSWGLSTKVYLGTDSCYKAPCIDTSFIEDQWGYRSHVREVLDSGNATGPHPKASDVRPGEDFWQCSQGKKYTLLVISPQSDVAIKLSNNPTARKCIEEVVVMGGFFAKSENGEIVNDGKDESTRDALMMGTVPAPNPVDGNTELNIVSDIKAARAVLSMGFSMKMMPLEVASIDRVGRQLITGAYTSEKQQTKTTEAVRPLCGPLGQAGRATSMLEAMACIHASGGDVATLDMDAIASTWLWTGKKHYKLKSKEVTVQKKDGQTQFCSFASLLKCCNTVSLGWEFDAVGWFADLKALLNFE